MRFYVHNESWVFDRDPETARSSTTSGSRRRIPISCTSTSTPRGSRLRGLDLIEYVEKLERDDRITHFHIKEWNGTPQVTPSPPARHRCHRLARVFKALKKPEKYWYILESEGQTDPKASALAAYDYLATLKG